MNILKKYLSILIGITLALQSAIAAESKVISTSTATVKSKVTLEDAKKYAANFNYEIRSLKHSLDAADQKKNKAGSAFYPEVGIAGGYESTNSSEKSVSAPLGYAYGKLNLFRGFADTNKVEIAGLQVEIAREKLKQKEFVIGLEVERYFHTYVYNRRLLALTTDAITANNKHIGTVKQRRASGMTSNADVMEFALRDALLKSETVSLQESLEEARVNLKKILGEEVGSKIEPVGELMHQHLLGQLNDYLQQAEKNENITIATKELAVASAERKLNAAKWLPEVDFEIQSGLLPLDKSNDEGNATNILLVGRLPLFAGLESLYDRREKIALQESSRENLKDKILNVISDVETRFRRLKAIETRVDLELENTGMAKRYYSAITSEYSRGVKNSADVKSAADAYLEAQTREEKYKFDFLIERIELEKILAQPVKTEVLNDDHQRKGKK